MGATTSTERLNHLTSLGFSVPEARLALDATGGNLEQAEALLRAKRERETASSFGQKINLILKQQRPWTEFFERFLWPEHLEERIATNLLYYQANYLVLCCGITAVSVLLDPALLLLTLATGGVVGGAASWDGDARAFGVPTPLTLQQRLGFAGIVASLMVNSSGHASKVFRIALLCGGATLAHASFRARNLKARWTFFKEELKVD